MLVESGCVVDLNNKQLIIKRNTTHGETTIDEILQMGLKPEEEGIVDVID